MNDETNNLETSVENSTNLNRFDGMNEGSGVSEAEAVSMTPDNSDGEIGTFMNQNEDLGSEVNITSSINSDMEESQNLITIEPMPNNSGVEEVIPKGNGSKVKKSKKGLFLALGIVLCIIIVLIVAFLVYSRFGFTAEKHIDKEVKKISNLIDNTFDSIDTSIDLNKDIKDSGSIKFTTSADSLKDLNNLKVDYDLEMPSDDKYIGASLNLTKGSTNIIKGNLYLDQTDLYIDSSDIFSSPLKYTLEEDYFQELESEEVEELTKVFTPEKIKNIVKKMVKYFGESLKEADLSTKSNGLNVTYEYKITEDNIEKINDKLSDLISKDKDFDEFRDYLDDTYLDLEPMTVRIVVSTLSNEVQSFEIIIDEERLVGKKIGKDKYRVGDGENYFEYELSDKKFAMKTFIDGIDSFELSINAGKSIRMHYDADGVKIEINGTFDKNTINLSLTSEGNGNKVDMNVKANYDKKNNITTATGKINVTADGEQYNVEYDEKLEVGDNIVEKKSINNARTIDSLTEDEQMTLYNNLMTKLSYFGDLSSLFGTDSSYDDELTTDDDLSTGGTLGSYY